MLIPFNIPLRKYPQIKTEQKQTAEFNVSIKYFFHPNPNNLYEK